MGSEKRYRGLGDVSKTELRDMVGAGFVVGVELEAGGSARVTGREVHLGLAFRFTLVVH